MSHIFSCSPQGGYRQNYTKWDIYSEIQLFWSHLLMGLHSIGIGKFVAETNKLVAVFSISLYYS